MVENIMRDRYMLSLRIFYPNTNGMARRAGGALRHQASGSVASSSSEAASSARREITP